MMALSSSSSSAASAGVLVEKATSEFLNGPDWTINIEICDSINSNNWQAKDVVKALKKRLQHKNPNVHLFALTLLETMVKNCGEYVHSQIVERNILQDMVKIVKKKVFVTQMFPTDFVYQLLRSNRIVHLEKTDMRVREKILVLLDSWQEAFGGPRGKYPQFYWAYDELRRSGVEFPPRTSESALIFTPPVTHPPIVYPQAGYGMPINSSTRLDEAMASEVETLSLSSISSMRDVLDLLAAMLQAINPNDRMAIKDEVIVELVHQCRSNQKKLMQMLANTGDEELLGRGLDLNDGIQNELAKHDAIASGSPLPTQVVDVEPPVSNVSNPIHKAAEVGVHSGPIVVPPAVVEPKRPTEKEDEEEEEEDDFALLARRHTKTQSVTSQSLSVGTNETAESLGMALALTDPPAPVKTSKEQDMIDLLSLTLSTTTVTSPQASSSQNINNLYASQQYPGNQGQVAVNGYVAPWAQTQNQTHTQTPPQQQQHPQSQFQQPQSQFQQPTYYSQAQPQSHFQRPTFHSQAQPHSQFQQPTYNSQPQPRSQFQQPTYNSQAQPQTQTHTQLQQPQPQLQPQPPYEPQALNQPQPPQPLHQQSQQQPHSQFQSQLRYEPQAQPQHSHLQQPQQRPQSYFQPQPEQTLVQQQPQQSQLQTEPAYQQQAQPPQPHLQAQSQYPELSSGYPPPPWAATPGYYSNKSMLSNPYGYSTSQVNTSTQHRPVQAARPSQQANFPSTVGSSMSTNSNAQMSLMPGGNAATAGQKPFVPSYRLFEDLNVLGSGEGRFSAKNTSGTSSQSMVGGRK